MAFYEEPEPLRGQVQAVVPGVMRIVANNPSKMTYHGTNTYLLDTADGTYVVDPGPVDDERHLDAILKALEHRPAGIIISHHHHDHFGAVPRLKSLTGLKVYGSSLFAGDAFLPDVLLNDGDRFSGIEVLHTPGHASDHLCFGLANGVTLTGDHIMTWSSSIVRLPDGDMQAYCAQLQRFLQRDDTLYLPGHGPPLPNPKPYTAALLEHRGRRDRSILQHIAATPATAAELARQLYDKKDPRIAWAAERNVEAHLNKLLRENLVRETDGIWTAV